MQQTRKNNTEANLVVAEPHELGEVGDDWMLRLLQTPLIRKLPPLQLPRLFNKMQPCDFAAGETVVRQGEAGDAFYVVASGRCAVIRERGNGKPLPLAELRPGDSFGEEALISEVPRTATVTMLEPGRLLRLDRDDFRVVMRSGFDAKIELAEAEPLVAAGRARWLDVRLASEYARDGRRDAINIPLHLLRLKYPQLERGSIWICCCDDGRRSATAAFLLYQRGFETRTFATRKAAPR